MDVAAQHLRLVTGMGGIVLSNLVPCTVGLGHGRSCDGRRVSVDDEFHIYDLVHGYLGATGQVLTASSGQRSSIANSVVDLIVLFAVPDVPGEVAARFAVAAMFQS